MDKTDILIQLFEDIKCLKNGPILETKKDDENFLKISVDEYKSKSRIFLIFSL